MEMSNNYMPELHVAQQRRRDKLRVQQLEDLQSNNFHHHLASSSSGGLNNNNTSSMVFPSDMLSFATSQQGTFANIHPSRFIAPSSSDSCEPQPLQTCGNWVSNYDDDQTHVDHGRRNFIMSQFSGHNPTPVAEVSIAQHYQNNVHGWESTGNELALLPAFVGQPNDAGAHTHGLSLSLSSNQINEMHQLAEPRELKPLESGSISSIVKLGCGNNSSPAQDIVGSSIQMYRNVGPLGPFTGYSTILKSSKFLKPAQQLLDDFFSASGVRPIRGCEEVESMSSRSSNLADCSGVLALKFPASNDLSSGSASCESYRPDCHEKRAKLLHMQEEVCKRHKQYHQQMQMVISAFELVPGLGNATPYIARSLKTISRHFRCLKNTIADQLKLIRRALGEDLSSTTSFLKGESTTSRFDHNFAKIKSGAAGGTGYGSHQNHVWRPQRGLPERAVSILRAWLFDHFLHPYPTDTDKQMLASQTGLSRNQVSNWFINARVRLWKPMVEDIHMLETKGTANSELNMNSRLSVIANNRQASGSQSGCKPAVNAICDSKQLECLGSSSCIEGSRSEMNTEQLFQKCSRMDSHQIPTSMDNSFISFLPYQRRGIELGGIGAVSLTLGLRQGSETTQQQLQHQFQHQGMHYGGHVMHDF